MTNSGRYSIFIRPILYVVDLLLLLLTTHFFLSQGLKNKIVLVVMWVFLSGVLSFYGIYRFTKITKVIALITRQTAIFILLLFTYFYITKITIQIGDIFNFLFFLYMALVVWRTSVHFLLKKYRILTGSNFKKVVIIGSNQYTKRLKEFF